MFPAGLALSGALWEQQQQLMQHQTMTRKTEAALMSPSK
jgi:hypothetical protein